ncbi:hypothetical protein E1B28_000753 [Marasmius oreades]|uniref:Zinc-finger domain-containing protein n=1 Tax=Marasmius oreades TaxID=181124 RepID=A0A9P8AEY2_9AGAR|nr:uncharacterized protein E1B28_000753 [Marasmius oreades]KAG7098850.1 hypothetical protein E1B28_000753 [Marasmius oreades]
MTSSSSTPRTITQSLLRRTQQVYVEIPPSPFHTSRPSATSPNPPLSPTRSNMPQAPDATTRKRKLSNAQLPNTKKQKLELKSRPQKENALGPANECTTTSQGTATYCHQCGKKREFSELVFCTATHTLVKSGKERRCAAKYCLPCIRNRYSQDFESTQAAEQRVQKVSPKYICPKCRDLCNCSICRKAKGLEPLGKQPSRPNVQTNGKKPVPNTKLSTKSSVSAFRSDPAQPEPFTKPPSKPLPKVRWQSLPVNLSLEEVEARMQIREFVLRFERTVGRNIGKGNLEELECITGNNVEDTTNWVSEGCVKAVILGLLGTLADEEDGAAARVIQKTMKEIRSSGINLTKIWTFLASLRDSLCAPANVNQSVHSGNSESSEGRIIIEFPDPLPPTKGIVTNYNTRSSRSASNKDTSPGVIIVNSSQLVPVIIGLLNTVVESHTIREELEEGIKRSKEVTREVREGIKREHERWEQLKQIHATLPSEIIIAKVGEDRHAHKKNIQGLENSLKVVLVSCLPRFSPLGTDHDGRVFWAMSPGIRDREFAASVITAATAESSKRRKPMRRPKSNEEIASFKCWSWFVAVWGQRPLLGGVNETESDSDENKEGWWVFWEPEEIRKLSSWITIRNGLDVKPGDCDGARSKQQLRNLVKNLQEYSTTLEWRCNGGEEML